MAYSTVPTEYKKAFKITLFCLNYYHYVAIVVIEVDPFEPYFLTRMDILYRNLETPLFRERHSSPLHLDCELHFFQYPIHQNNLALI